MNYYDTIQKLDLPNLKIGEPVYLRMLKPPSAKSTNIAALVTTKDDAALGITYIGDNVPVTVNLDLVSYGTDWLLLRKLLAVHTPDGDIVATDKEDSEYPGIKLTLHRADNTSNVDILLAMTEYITGGELIGTNDFRRTDKEDMRKRTVGFNRTTRRMTAGLVTRAFPDDGHNDRQIVALHHGHQQKATIVMYDTDCQAVRAILDEDNPKSSGHITYTAEFPDQMQAVFDVNTNNGETESSLSLIDINNHTCAIIRDLTGWSGKTMRLTYMGIEYAVSFKVM